MTEIVIQPDTKVLTVADGETVFILDNLADNQVTKLQIIIGQKARVKYLFLASGNNIDQADREILIGDDTKLESFQAYLDSNCCQVSFLNNIGARVNINQKALFIMKDEQRLQINDRHIFYKPAAQGNFLAEGLVCDSARAEYFSELIVKPEAQLTDSRIDLKLSLLGQEARGLMQPALYIEANEVKVGHGASTLNLGAAELFYLNSRGIEEVQAKRLIIKSTADRFVRAIDELRGQKLIQNLLDHIL